jgi:hypothetical protein
MDRWCHSAQASDQHVRPVRPGARLRVADGGLRLPPGSLPRGRMHLATSTERGQDAHRARPPVPRNHRERPRWPSTRSEKARHWCSCVRRTASKYLPTGGAGRTQSEAWRPNALTIAIVNHDVARMSAPATIQAPASRSERPPIRSIRALTASSEDFLVQTSRVASGEADPRRLSSAAFGAPAYARVPPCVREQPRRHHRPASRPWLLP